MVRSDLNTSPGGHLAFFTFNTSAADYSLANTAGELVDPTTLIAIDYRNAVGTTGSIDWRTGSRNVYTSTGITYTANTWQRLDFEVSIGTGTSGGDQFRVSITTGVTTNSSGWITFNGSSISGGPAPVVSGSNSIKRAYIAPTAGVYNLYVDAIVPEPASLTLLAGGGALMLARRRA
jgi:hypothetical protein